MRAIISMLKPLTSKLKDEFYRIDISSFANLIGRKDEGTSLFKDMRRALKKLNTTPVTIMKPNGE